MVSTGQPVKSLEHVEERLELRRLKGLLGNIGGLLKQAIAAEAADRAEVSRLLRQIDERQRSIQALIDRIT
ncbi:Putative plasmid conjugal transfer protein (fragment) [uncultured delta proteobacterium]|uniref:Putative plasmid conjugal transfer protein n=1 Tax=uncultured delta proteobacterium TaxID=34034 RepID=A0A212J167_9DELT